MSQGWAILSGGRPSGRELVAVTLVKSQPAGSCVFVMAKTRVDVFLGAADGTHHASVTTVQRGMVGRCIERDVRNNPTSKEGSPIFAARFVGPKASLMVRFHDGKPLITADGRRHHRLDAGLQNTPRTADLVGGYLVAKISKTPSWLTPYNGKRHSVG